MDEPLFEVNDLKVAYRRPGHAPLMAVKGVSFTLQAGETLGNGQEEVVAGGIEEGEAPDVAAHRELREESGYLVKRLLPLGSIFACPGYSEEQLHLFYADVEEAPGETDFDPDENVVTLEFSREAVEAAILDGTISDAKTLSAWLFWKLRGPAE